MWIMSTHGFISVTPSEHDDDTMIVRSRVARHITDVLPGAIVKTTPEDEYPFETLVDLEDVHQLMHNALIDDGFSPGKAMSDPDYSKAAKQVFNTLRDTLKKPPMVLSMERKQHIMMN
jgi:hypothetical protein